MPVSDERNGVYPLVALQLLGPPRDAGIPSWRASRPVFAAFDGVVQEVLLALVEHHDAATREFATTSDCVLR